jgi:hypothetical protein
MTKPITPREAKKLAGGIPDEVLEVVNDFIAKNGGRPITIIEKELVRAIVTRHPSITSAMLYERHWLDFEAIYRGAGWKVEYDKPGYNETYEASWSFEPEKSR